VHLLCAAIALFNSLIFGTTCSAETNYYYYCPRGNGAIAGNDHYLQGKMSLAFPDGAIDRHRSSKLFSPLLQWTLLDCSDKQFECFDVQSEGTMPSRRVFVPRHPEIGKTYHDGNSSAFVTGSSTSSTVPTIQVVDSQQIGKSVAMIKLTLRRGVGAIYIDGLNFWNPEAYQDGETCVLESTVGLFSKTHVNAPPPQNTTDF
jgi:hypothetical protein